MCGIAGAVRWGADGDEAELQHRTDAMVAALAHRGPDARGTARSGPAVLGAARLAIRGLADGHQPMVHPHSGVVVVCNGEIDNHEDLKAELAALGRPVGSRNDVAVIADLYAVLGLDCVARLEGAFALAIWDPAAERLILARDRAGERPLYYLADEQGVTFASELAALVQALDAPPLPDPEGLGDYLSRGYVGAPASPLTGVRKLGPAQLLVFAREERTARRYWRWGLPAPAGGAAGTAEFDRVFRAAVRRQSEVEVPYGVFLSGGLDSSLIAAVLHDLRPHYPLTAYTLRFRETSFDEGPFALEVARTLAIPCETVWVEAREVPEVLALLIAHTGEPLADPAWIPAAMLARRAARDVRIALVGEGGDELFGGYPTYLGARLAARYQALPGALRCALAALLRRWPPSDRKVSLSFLLKKFVAAAELDGLARHLAWTASIDPVLLKRLGVAPHTPRIEPAPAGEDLLGTLQRYDLEHSLAEGLLTKADRAGMLSAIELRAPFLDPGVLDFAARLTPRQRLRGVTTKVFLKDYARRYLPRAIVHRRKRGLSVPLSAWLRGPLYPWAEARLANPRLGEAGIRPGAALALLAEHRERKADLARPLWTLIVLSEWLDWAGTS